MSANKGFYFYFLFVFSLYFLFVGSFFGLLHLLHHSAKEPTSSLICSVRDNRRLSRSSQRLVRLRSCFPSDGRSILTASRPSSLLFSARRSIETHLSLTLSHTTILFCSPVLASTAPFTSISDQSTVSRGSVRIAGKMSRGF